MLTLFIIIFLLSILACTISYSSILSNTDFLDSNFHYNLNSSFSWPIFGYYSISSFFGIRTSPTNGASSYHSGIDIPAPPNTNIYSICDGIVEFTGFLGADGYSIIVKNNNFKIIYGHTSPNYIVSINSIIYKNQKIGNVGPKYIDSNQNTSYIDTNGKKLNGATTRTTSSFNNKKRRHSRQSVRLLIIYISSSKSPQSNSIKLLHLGQLIS